MINLEELSARLKNLREENNLLQSEVCRATKINQPTLSNIESGRNFNIEAFLTLYNYYSERMDSATVISRLFNVSDAYTGIIIQKLKLLNEKQQLEINSLIRSIE
jgi:transcriptional regulator with XRE-family HTH domain